MSHGGHEEAEGRVVAQAGIQREGRTDAPGILRVEAEAAYGMRRSAVAGAGSVGGGAVGKIRIGSGGKRVRARRQNGRIGDIEAGVARIGEQRFRVAGQRAAKNGLVDEINAEAQGMTSAGMRQVVAELIFLLVALNGESGNGGGELIVAKRFAAGGSKKIRGEGKIERFSDVGVTRLGVMKTAGCERERAEGGRRKLKLLV